VDEALRVAVVGCGGIATAIYLPLLDVRDEAPVAAIVDLSAEVLARTSERYPNAVAAADVADLDPGSIDCALVLTPVMEGVDAHHDPVLALMQMGVPTLCEKPFSAYMERTEAMSRASEETGTPLTMSLNRRFAPVYARAREFIGDNPVTSFVAEKSGGGAIFRDAITNSLHSLDALRFFCGEATEVRSWYRHDGEAGLNTAVAISFDSGATGVYLASRDAGRWIETAEFHAGGRTARIDAPYSVVMSEGGELATYAPDLHRWQLPEPERWGFGAQLDHFLACVRGDEKPHVDLTDIMASHRLAERVRLLS